MERRQCILLHSIASLVANIESLQCANPAAKSLGQQTYPKPLGGNNENTLTTYLCRIGNQLCFADPCPTKRTDTEC